VFAGNGVGTLTGPFGWFGREKTVPVTFSGLSLTLGEAPHHRVSAVPIPWTLIIQIAEILVPLIIQDFKDGKKPWQIVLDAVQTILGLVFRSSPPPAGK
jgi:hypothetical protein